MKYPRIKKLGLAIYSNPDHVKHSELKAALSDKWFRFCSLLGICTAHVDGPYAHDVEAVLERMATGKLIGTQKFQD